MNDVTNSDVTAARLPGLAYVMHSLDPGGTERLAVDMSVALSGEFNVSVYCLDSPGAWAAELREQGIPVHCVWRQPGFDISVPARLARHFRSAGIDLVHAHQCTPWFYAALSRIGYPSPKLLLEEHGRFHPEPDSWLRRLVNRAVIAPLTHRFVAVSRDVRSRLVRFEGLKARKIDVIYNGVQQQSAIAADERQSLRRELGFDDADFVVGTVGRLDPIKNLPMFLKAVAAQSSEIQQLKGLVVGDGPMASELASLSAELGLTDRVNMTGFRADARSVTACMDMFILCSFSEGTSMALLEAMAAGVPVVVTDVGGNPEIVEEGISGRVIPSDDVDALAATIDDAVQNAEQLAEMAVAGRRRFEERFSFDAMLENYRAMYRELLPDAMNSQGMSAEVSEKMSFRRILKAAVFSFSLIVVLPLVVLSWLEKALSRSEGVFNTFAQLVAVVPGPVGSYLRAAYYYGTLDECSWETHFGFGSVFSHRGARIAANVSSGSYCVIGHATVESGVRLASRVSIPSGKRQHLDESGQMISGTRYDRVALGRDCWIGEGAIVMADVGAGSIVSAGSVVLNDAPPQAIVGGNPAKVVKSLDSSPPIEERS